MSISDSNIRHRSSLRFLFAAFCLLLAAVIPSKMAASESEEEGLDVKTIIFEHLGDGYGWEVPFSHNYRIPLPVIICAEDGSWHCFSSGDLAEVHSVADPESGKTKAHRVAVVKTIGDGSTASQFIIGNESSAHKDKLVQIFPLTPEEQAQVDAKVDELSAAGNYNPAKTPIDGFIYVDGKYYREYRPFDLSITKNVAALFIAAFLVMFIVFGMGRYYRKNGLKAPTGAKGFFEVIFNFIYNDTIKATLGEKAPKFAPYLLTAFFFILVMNLVGLIVIFPGGANLTGNIAVTLVLALCTFIVTNVFGSKHYWKDIFWPDVPIWLKCPLPIMQLIEVFGMFTKPAALCVRLFANMMGGHMIVITLTLLIFIFTAFGVAATSASVVLSVAFSIFMLLLDTLVSFIQAYVFTLLSTIFIGLAQAHEEHNEHPAVEQQ